VLALGENSTANRGIDFATAAKRAVQLADVAQQDKPGHGRLDTGIGSVDALWKGLWPGQLYYVMARSRTGKTPFMMQLARNVAETLLAEAEITQKPPGHVHIFLLEMTANDLLTVNLASVTQYSADDIRSGNIGRAHGEDDTSKRVACRAWLKFEADALALGRLPIMIDDEPNMDLPALIMRARATKRQRLTRLICIDYRELVRRGREQERMQLPEWIPFLGYQLKALAKTTNCPVIALAQINKTRSGELPVRPTLDDLPYDGGQAADGVFALRRPELYMPLEPPRVSLLLGDEKKANVKSTWEQERAKVRDVTEFIALKRRFGPTGYPARLRFDGPRMLLSDWDIH
jgi:replicative DNA helicase